MSQIPFLLNEMDFYRPTRILDQHFGMGLDHSDLSSPISVENMPRMMLWNPSQYFRPWRHAIDRSDTGSTVSVDKDKFQVNLDVQQFAPEEITVKVTGENYITIEGKHEEKQDKHGYVSRQFVRRYMVPKEHNIDRIASKLSSDGVLTITAPRINVKQVEHRQILVIKTGVPTKTIQKKNEEQK